MRNIYKFSNEHEEGDVYVCPKCFRTVHINLIQTNEIDVRGCQDLQDLDLGIMFPELPVICTRCYETMFKCDNTFVDRIIRLNTMGFPTVFYCEGHLEHFFSIKMPDILSDFRIVNPYLVLDFCQISEENKCHINDAIHKSDSIYSDNDLGRDLITIYPIIGGRECPDYEAKCEYIKEARAKLYKFVDVLLIYAANNLG